MTRVFVDTNVPLYASGRPHPLREPARRAIRAIGRGDVDAVTSVGVFQELLHLLAGRGRARSGLARYDAFRLLMPAEHILPLELADVDAARLLAAEHPTLEARDAFHLAVMQRNRIESILTAEHHFDDVPGVIRIDLADFGV